MTQKRDSKGRFLSKMGKPKYYKLLEYGFKGYKVSIKNVVRSMSVKEIEELFKAMKLLELIVENTLNDFESEYLEWGGVLYEPIREELADKKEEVFRLLKELLKEI